MLERFGVGRDEIASECRQTFTQVLKSDSFVKITIVNTTFLPERAGGAELHTLWVAQELQRRGHTVAIVRGGPHGQEESSSDSGGYKEEAIEGIQVLRLAINRDPDAFGWGNHSGVTSWARAYLKKENPRIVLFGLFWGLCGIGSVCAELAIPYLIHCHLYSVICQNGFLLQPRNRICDGFAAPNKCSHCLLKRWSFRHRLMAKIFDRLPKAWALHHQDLARAWSGLQEVREVFVEGRAFAERATYLTVPSRFVRDEIIKNGFDSEHVAFLANGLPPAIVGNVKSSKLYRRDTPEKTACRVGVISRISPEKGLGTLAQAFSDLPQYRSAVLHIYGGGSERYVQELKQQTEADPRIQFMGHVPNHQVSEIIKGLDYLAVPSECKETSGISAREALALGTPVLASKAGGLAEAVRNGLNGLLFEPGNVEQLKECLRKILDGNAPGKPLPFEKRNIVTISDHVDQLELLLEKAISR